VLRKVGGFFAREKNLAGRSRRELEVRNDNGMIDENRHKVAIFLFLLLLDLIVLQAN